MSPIPSAAVHYHVVRNVQNSTGAVITQGGNSSVYVAGIVVISVALAGLIFWLSLRYLRKSASASVLGDLEGTEKPRAPNPHPRYVSTVWDGSVIPTPPATASPSSSPRIHIGPNSAPSPFISSYSPPVPLPNKRYSAAMPPSPSKLRQSIRPSTPNENRMSTATMTENELIDYHLCHGNFPSAFAPALVGHNTLSPRRPGSTASQQASKSATALPRLTSGPVTQTPQHKNSGHSRLGSLTASIRHSFFSSSPPTSPTRSIFNFGLGKRPFRSPSTIPTPTAENQRTIIVTSFVPLLPDELVLKPGAQETVTVVETYDDGWCIVARMNLGVLEVGAVPEWVFGLKDGEDETFGTMRPMRSTSLGVTVDLKVIEQPGEKPGTEGHWALAMTDARASVISWSNF